MIGSALRRCIPRHKRAGDHPQRRYCRTQVVQYYRGRLSKPGGDEEGCCQQPRVAHARRVRIPRQSQDRTRAQEPPELGGGRGRADSIGSRRMKLPQRVYRSWAGAPAPIRDTLPI